MVYLFVGLGLSGFLSITHSWFYGYLSTGFTIFVDAVGAVAVVAGLGQPNSWPRTSLPFGRRLLHVALWVVPALLYLFYSACGRLLLTSAKLDPRYEGCFREAFVLWATYLLVGGRLFAQLAGMSWYTLWFAGIFTLFHRRNGS